MPDPTPIYQEAAKLSQEAYKAAKANTDTIITDMSSRTASIFRETVEKAKVLVNEVGEKAMAEAVQDLAYRGIYASSHVDKNGRLYRVPSDVAVRQAVYTSGRQRFNSQVLGVAQRTGQDLIEVNSTPNCRPSHEVINGGVFSISGLNPRYRRWTGDMQALLSDYNCGHEVAIYYPDQESVFTDPLEGTGYTLEEARKAFAKQRRYENEIRKQKRVVEALKAGGMDTTEANAKLNATRHRLKKHIDENSAILRRERHREQLYDSAQRMKKRNFPPPAPKVPSVSKPTELHIVPASTPQKSIGADLLDPSHFEQVMLPVEEYAALNSAINDRYHAKYANTPMATINFRNSTYTFLINGYGEYTVIYKEPIE